MPDSVSCSFLHDKLKETEDELNRLKKRQKWQDYDYIRTCVRLEEIYDELRDVCDKTPWWVKALWW